MAGRLKRKGDWDSMDHFEDERENIWNPMDSIEGVHARKDIRIRIRIICIPTW